MRRNAVSVVQSGRLANATWQEQLSKCCVRQHPIAASVCNLPTALGRLPAHQQLSPPGVMTPPLAVANGARRRRLRSLCWPMLLLVVSIMTMGTVSAGGRNGFVSTILTTAYPNDVYVNGTTGDILFTQLHSLHRIYGNGTVALLAGSTSYGNADAIGAAASFNILWGIVLRISNPNLVYLVDCFNRCLRHVDLATRNVSTFAGLCGPNNTGSVDGIGTVARFGCPVGIALSHNASAGMDEYLYVPDYDNSIIRRVDVATANVETFAGAARSQGADDGPRKTTARFYGPTDVAVDATGRWVYVVDYYHCIRKIDAAGSNGMVTTLAGTCGSSGFVDGVGSAALFRNPYGITINIDGSAVYVAEFRNCAIRRVATADGHVTTVTGKFGCGSNGNLYGVHYYVRQVPVAANRSIVLNEEEEEEEGLVVTDFGNNASLYVSEGADKGHSLAKSLAEREMLKWRWCRQLGIWDGETMWTKKALAADSQRSSPVSRPSFTASRWRISTAFKGTCTKLAVYRVLPTASVLDGEIVLHPVALLLLVRNIETSTVGGAPLIVTSQSLPRTLH